MTDFVILDKECLNNTPENSATVNTYDDFDDIELEEKKENSYFDKEFCDLENNEQKDDAHFEETIFNDDLENNVNDTNFEETVFNDDNLENNDSKQIQNKKEIEIKIQNNEDIDVNYCELQTLKEKCKKIDANIIDIKNILAGLIFASFVQFAIILAT